MKPQDIIFFLILAFLIYKRKSRWLVIVGILSLLISIPLFAKWIFFTAERLTWYAAGFFFIACILELWNMRKEKE